MRAIVRDGLAGHARAPQLVRGRVVRLSPQLLACPDMLKITTAESAAEYQQIRELMGEYIEWDVSRTTQLGLPLYGYFSRRLPAARAEDWLGKREAATRDDGDR